MVAPRGACVVAPGGGVRGFFDEIRSMSGRYASYWNAFLLILIIHIGICLNEPSLRRHTLVFIIFLNGCTSCWAE